MPQSPVTRSRSARASSKPEGAASGATPVLQLDRVTKVFFTEEFETHALSEVQLEVAEGEFVTISGPSGSGKSTLLSILGLLDTPTSGSYRLAGREATGLSANQRAALRSRDIGFIFQSFNLIPDLDVEENVMLPLSYQGLSKAQRRERAAAALARVGMSHRARHMPSQLSGGQQQRVAVARAVAGEPKILLADEPTGNLDSANGEAVMALLRELHEGGATICMVTHDLRHARHAERTISLFDGRIVDSEDELVGGPR